MTNKIRTTFKILLLYLLLNVSIADDLRDIKIGSNIAGVPERGYVNLKCDNQIAIQNWESFKTCEKNSNNFYIISFEYDERFAVTEEYEGTQVSGHPVLLNIAVDESGTVHEININTDPKAPFYFRKQSHLLWLRVYAKYGGQGWNCKEKKPLEGHIKIGKKYMNKICVKSVQNKLITIHTQFYFIGDKSNRDNLVSKSYLQIKLDRKV